MVALVLCPFARDEPGALLGLVEILKFRLVCVSNFACSRCSGQRKP